MRFSCFRLQGKTMLWSRAPRVHEHQVIQNRDPDGDRSILRDLSQRDGERGLVLRFQPLRNQTRQSFRNEILKNDIRRILLFDTKRFSVLYQIFESELYWVAPRYSERADGHVTVAGDREIRSINPKGWFLLCRRNANRISSLRPMKNKIERRAFIKNSVAAGLFYQLLPPLKTIPFRETGGRLL